MVADVHQKFNIPTAELVAGLSADTVTASSNIIHVTLVGQHDQNLTGAVREATVVSMDAIAQPTLIAGAKRGNRSRRRCCRSRMPQSIDFVAQYGNPSPAAYYNVQSTRLSNLEAQYATAKMNNDVKLLPTLTATISTQRRSSPKPDSSWPSTSHWPALSRRRQPPTTMLRALSSPRKRSWRRIIDPSTVTVVNVGRLSKLSDVIKFAGIAFALALLMMLGLILILELMRSGRRPVAAKGPRAGLVRLAGRAARLVAGYRDHDPGASRGSTDPDSPGGDGRASGSLAGGAC